MTKRRFLTALCAILSVVCLSIGLAACNFLPDDNNKDKDEDTDPVYKLTYDLDGGAGEVPAAKDYKEGETVTVHNGEGLTKDKFDFTGWKDGETDVAAGSTFTMPARDVTLKAQWTKSVFKGIWKSSDEDYDYYVVIDGEGGQDTAGNDYFGYLFVYIDIEGYGSMMATFNRLYVQDSENKFATLPASEAATATDVITVDYNNDGTVSLVVKSDGEVDLELTNCAKDTTEGTFAGKWVYEDDDSSLSYDYSFDFDTMTGTYTYYNDEEPQPTNYDAHFVVGNVAAFFSSEDLQEGCFVIQSGTVYNFTNTGGGFGVLDEYAPAPTTIEGIWSKVEGGYGDVDEYIYYIDLVEGQDYAANYIYVDMYNGAPYEMAFGHLTKKDGEANAFEDSLGSTFTFTEKGRLEVTVDYGFETDTTVFKKYTAFPAAPSFSGKLGGYSEDTGTTLVIDFDTYAVTTDYGTFESHTVIGDAVVFTEAESSSYIIVLPYAWKDYALVCYYEDVYPGMDIYELVAVKDSFTVTYEKGAGADDATVPAAATVQFGGTAQLPDTETAYREGYRLMGWACPEYVFMEGDYLAPGEYIFVLQDLTFTAVWKVDEDYTVSFSAGEGVTDATVPASKTVHGGELLDEESLSPEPSRDGYVFSHWEKNGEEYDFSEPVEENFTLTAVWKVVATYTFKGNFTVKGYYDSYFDGMQETTITLTEITFTLTGDQISGFSYKLAEGDATEAEARTATFNFDDMTEKWEYADLYFCFNYGSGPAYTFYFFVSKDRTQIIFTDAYANVQQGTVFTVAAE